MHRFTSATVKVFNLCVLFKLHTHTHSLSLHLIKIVGRKMHSFFWTKITANVTHANPCMTCFTVILSQIFPFSNDLSLSSSLEHFTHNILDAVKKKKHLKLLSSMTRLPFTFTSPSSLSCHSQCNL